MKRKIITLIMLIAIIGTLLAVFVGCSGDRSKTLRIANWGEYMSKETYEGFVEWYKEKTGEDVVIDYDEFDTNENLYTWVARKHDDYDLICPSDYMIQRMKSEGLLLKLSDETLEVLNKAMNPSIVSMVKSSYDEEFAYSMPYVWGTLGIMFNTKSDGTAGISSAEAAKYNTWEAFWDAANKDKIFMKDSARDAYTVALLYDKRNELATASKNFTDYTTAEYQALLSDIFTEASDATIAAAKTQLTAQRNYVYDYEVDSGKDDMLRNSEEGYFGLFWSCDAGYIMNGDTAGSKDLCYIVPKEGSNVWIDGFAIPKYAKNEKAANYFIQYLCETSVAYECMDYVGSTTAVKAAADQYKADLESDEDGFFAGAYDGFKEMYLEMMFPSEATLSRCAVMMDLGKYNEALDNMWIEVTQ